MDVRRLVKVRQLIKLGGSFLIGCALTFTVISYFVGHDLTTAVREEVLPDVRQRYVEEVTEYEDLREILRSEIQALAESLDVLELPVADQNCALRELAYQRYVAAARTRRLLLYSEVFSESQLPSDVLERYQATAGSTGPPAC